MLLMGKLIILNLQININYIYVFFKLRFINHLRAE